MVGDTVVGATDDTLLLRRCVCLLIWEWCNETLHLRNKKDITLRISKLITSFPPLISFINPFHTANLNWSILNLCQIQQKFTLKTNVRDYQEAQILTYLTFSQVTKHIDFYIKVEFFFFQPATFLTTTQVPSFFLEENMWLNR